jgi:hypothetical protein
MRVTFKREIFNLSNVSAKMSVNQGWGEGEMKPDGLTYLKKQLCQVLPRKKDLDCYASKALM